MNVLLAKLQAENIRHFFTFALVTGKNSQLQSKPSPSWTLDFLLSSVQMKKGTFYVEMRSCYLL